MNKILANLILFVVLSLPAASLAEQIDGIAVIVNDDPITNYEVGKEQGDMEKALAGNPAKKTVDDGQLREAALNSLINKKLITQKIKELDIKISDEEIKQAIEDIKKQNNISQETLVAALNSQGISYEQYKAQLREQLERLRLISQEVRSKIQITEKEVRDFYSANPEKFKKEESFRARLITLKIPADASPEQRKRLTEKASAIFTEAKSGKNFEELARKYSDDPSAKEGGDLGTFKKGEMLPEFEAALMKLQPGEVGEPFATQSGIHIVKLEERSQVEGQSYEKVRREIEDILYKKKSEERFNQWLAELRKNAAIDMR